jgi:hypothetical protein
VPEPDATTPLETIHRLCALVYYVNDAIFGWGDGPCDCFCPDREGDKRLWRSTGAALRFVEDAVRSAVLKRIADSGSEGGHGA